ncbi:MAG TPA: type II secretion system protein N [Gammaproteobacteria bacterium]|nr:type II secretion system protein N [Gammaproteobacteria bacterium]
MVPRESHQGGVEKGGPSQTGGESSLNLVLIGTVATNDPVTGVAVLGESPHSARSYRVGEPVTPDAKLEAVYRDHVILDRAGVFETLAVTTTQPSSPSAYSAPPAGPKNSATLAAVVRPQPVFANGVQRGYRFYPTGDAQAFAALGLQHGDLVVEISGVPLDDPQGSMTTFNSILSPYGVNVTVERSGQRQVITLGTPPIVTSDGGFPGPPGPTP